MSKNFNPKYTIDLAECQIDNFHDLELAELVGKLNASALTTDDVALLVDDQIRKIVEDCNLKYIAIDADGNAAPIPHSLYDTVESSMQDLVDSLKGIINVVEEAVEEEPKKEPWYKRAWHKIFPKKK